MINNSSTVATEVFLLSESYYHNKEENAERKLHKKKDDRNQLYLCTRSFITQRRLPQSLRDHGVESRSNSLMTQKQPWQISSKSPNLALWLYAYLKRSPISVVLIELCSEDLASTSCIKLRKVSWYKEWENEWPIFSTALRSTLCY